ncbi:hypothetical protein [Sphingomonas sp. R1]|uniref:hypothetical protein n=1 Tax=Sphingomonas sp. R1 TaxID=399176 RepID=UPI002224023F|nr:hypothetical protein [Sphingomonas sp. R1]UYY75847.1 hypothetical protein OIM94_09875 [Sphingomonas sp. R1]
MSVATAKVYWREAVEFVGYFVFMTTLGAAMVVLVRNAPQAHASWYIDTCIAVAAMTGAYAFRMYRRYRAARPAWTPVLTPVLDAEGGISPEERRQRNWSDRIFSEKQRETSPERVKLLSQLEAVEEAYRARCRARGEEPDRSSFEMRTSMTVEDIRRRIALRMDQ